jgi:ATP-dependent Clp protease ATP-binding subunit ClpA
MTDFIPFVPFSLGEQAVVAHKFLRELSRKVQESVNLSEGRDERLVGNVTMHVKHDASVCTTLAEAEYSRDLGARSLNGAVKEVEDKLLEVYFEQSDEIIEGGKILEVVVDAHAGEVLVTPA